MLARLMKYEIKATARWLLPLYGTILIFALINRFTLFSPVMVFNSTYTEYSIPNQPVFSIVKGIASALFMLIYVLLFVGVFVATLIITIQRYYKNLLGDEGYLMFTLPVKSWQHILNKLLVSLLWYLLSSVTAICSILILIPNKDWSQLSYVFRQLKMIYGTSGIIMLILLVILNLVLNILMIYSAISLGHLFNKHKLLISFGMYLGIEAVNQFIILFVMLITTKIAFGSLNDISFNYAGRFGTLFGILSVLTVLLSAGYFVLTSYLVNRKLNLE